MKKMRIGWITLTCSEDSTMVFLELLNKNFFDWSRRIEFAYCKVLDRAPELSSLSDIDVFFVEGAVSTDEEEEKLKHIRNISKHVVAVGSCACTGMPSAQRNAFSPRLKAEIASRLNSYNLRSEVNPLSKFIKVDDYAMGCPMVEPLFIKILNKYLERFGV